MPCRLTVVSYKGREEHANWLKELAQEREMAQVFWPVNEVLKSLAKPSCQLWFAWDGTSNHADGLVFCQQIASDVELLFIYVSSRKQRQGIAQALLNYCLQYYCAQGLTGVMRLEVRRSNIAAQRLYDKNGFLPRGQRKKYYSDGEDALIFDRSLTKAT